MSIAFNQPQITMGRTLQLYIGISNPASHSIRATHFQCVAEGTSLQTAAMSRLPDVINANSLFEINQVYTTAAPGSTSVHCILDAIDTSTGAAMRVSSPTLRVDVSPETRLYIEADSPAHTVKAQETVFLIAMFGNRGETGFTNVEVSCPELGRSLVFLTTPQAQNDLAPGTTGSVEYQLQAARSGVGYFVCSITATDTSTDTELTLFTPPVVIEVQ